MMTGSVASLQASNAAFGWMQLANARMNLAFRGNGLSSSALNSADTKYQLAMLNDAVQYQAYNLMADSFEKVKKDNIKRSFSIFA